MVDISQSKNVNNSNSDSFINNQSNKSSFNLSKENLIPEKFSRRNCCIIS